MAALGALADVAEMALGRLMIPKHYSSVTATDIERGQKPYGPSVYEARLVFQSLPFHTDATGPVPLYVDADRAKTAFRALCRGGWKDADEPVTDWFEARLVKCEPDAPSPRPERGFICLEGHSDSWVIRIERPYDD
jgi:hypothetical protein